MIRHVSGISLVTSFSLLSSIADVFVGNRVQVVDPICLVFFSFLLTVLFFSIFQIKHLKEIASLAKKSVKSLICINVVSVILWLGFFLSVKFLDPATTIVTIFGIGPSFSSFSERYIIGQEVDHSRISMVFSSLALLLTLGVIWGIFHVNISGLAMIPTSSATWGVLSALACGASVVFYTFLAKKLAVQGWRASSLMVARYPLLLLTTGLLIVLAEKSYVFSMDNFLTIILVAVLSNIVPPFLLQLGIERAEPSSVAFGLLLQPIFTFAVQNIDPRIRFSFSSLTLIIGIILFLGMATYMQNYKKRHIPSDFVVTQK